MEMLRSKMMLQAASLTGLDYMKINVHEAMLLVQLISFVCYLLILGAVMIYAGLRRRKTASQADAVIMDNLKNGIDTAVRWASGLAAAVLVLYAAMWFFGTAETMQTVEETLEKLVGFWMSSGITMFGVTLLMSLTMQRESECALFCKNARKLPLRLMVMGFLTLGLLAFLRC